MDWISFHHLSTPLGTPYLVATLPRPHLSDLQGLHIFLAVLLGFGDWSMFDRISPLTSISFQNPRTHAHEESKIGPCHVVHFMRSK